MCTRRLIPAWMLCGLTCAATAFAAVTLDVRGRDIGADGASTLTTVVTIDYAGLAQLNAASSTLQASVGGNVGTSAAYGGGFSVTFDALALVNRTTGEELTDGGCHTGDNGLATIENTQHIDYAEGMLINIDTSNLPANVNVQVTDIGLGNFTSTSGKTAVAQVIGGAALHLDAADSDSFDLRGFDLTFAGGTGMIPVVTVWNNSTTKTFRIQSVSLEITATPDLPPNPTNVLFIAVDDLNDWNSVMGGHPQALTPNIARLAQRGVLFTNTQCAAPACNPSRSALLCGISPATSTLYQNGGDDGGQFRQRPALQYINTLPQYLKNHGYRIAIAGKVFHGNPDLPASDPTIARASTDWDAVFNDLNLGDAGFNPNNNRPSDDFGGLSPIVPATGFTRQPLKGAPILVNNDGVIDRSPTTLDSLREGMSDYRVVRWAAQQITMANVQEQPLFMAAGIYRPHLDFEVPIQFFDAVKQHVDPNYVPARDTDPLNPHANFNFDLLVRPTIDPNDFDDIPITLDSTTFGGADQAEIDAYFDANQPETAELAWKTGVLAYLSCINFADSALGVLLDAVDQRLQNDPNERWLVVMWGDHGWHLGEKSTWRKFTLWEEATHMPLIIYQPGVTDGDQNTVTRVDTPVNLLDLYPTIVDLLDLPAAQHAQGTSLVPLIEEPTSPPDGISVTTDGEGWHGVRSQKWRFIHYPNAKELYNHAVDPLEWTNLANNPAYDIVQRQLTTALYRWSLLHANQALHSSLTLDAAKALGNLSYRNFDGVEAPLNNSPGWTSLLLATGIDCQRSADILTAPDGALNLATLEDFTLAGDEDFILSTKIQLQPDNVAAGVVFGRQDNEHFFSWTARSSTNSSISGVLTEFANGAPTERLRLETPQAMPDGWLTLVVDYAAQEQTLKLLVLKPDGVPYLQQSITLDPFMAGSRFGLLSEAAPGAAYDDFTVIAYQPATITNADADSDGDVDNADLEAYLACFRGPGHDFDGDCAAIDSDGDTDFDLRDFARYQQQTTGPRQ